MPSDLASLVGFVIAGVAVSMLIVRLARLAGGQAALRRVATLVAHSVPAKDLFAAATAEVGQLTGHRAPKNAWRPSQTCWERRSPATRTG
jgi:hypothetical protein